MYSFYKFTTYYIECNAFRTCFAYSIQYVLLLNIQTLCSKYSGCCILGGSTMHLYKPENEEETNVLVTKSIKRFKLVFSTLPFEGNMHLSMAEKEGKKLRMVEITISI
jgi:hypothetical protein